jgi:Flp pilus assembly protein TadG
MSRSYTEQSRIGAGPLVPRVRLEGKQMRILARQGRRDQRGAAAVEFAIISVLFITLIFAMIQYSLYFWSTQSSANAAREGARRGAVGETCTTLQSRTSSSVKLEQGSITVTRTYENPTTGASAPPSTGANVRVTITYNSLDLGFPFVPFLNNGAVEETAVARVENYSAAVAGNWSTC